MSRSCGNPRRRRRPRRPPPQSRRLRPRPRRRGPLLLPPCRLPPQPRPLLPQIHRLLPHRPRRLPHLHRLPLRAHRFQRRVATRGLPPLRSRQRTVARHGTIAIPCLVAAHHSKNLVPAHHWKTIAWKTIARALSRTSYQKESAANPACRGRVSVASAVATGVVVVTDLLPRHLPFLPSEPGDEAFCKESKMPRQEGPAPRRRHVRAQHADGDPGTGLGSLRVVASRCQSSRDRRTSAPNPPLILHAGVSTVLSDACMNRGTG